MKKIWPFTFFFLFFGAIAAFMPYMVLYFQSLKFSGPQIGLLTGISPLITLFTVPIWTRTADKTNKHRLIMGSSLLVSTGTLFLFPFVQSFVALFILILVANLFLAPVMSLANSASMFMLGEEKDLFGRVRVGGTIGFGVAALVVGLMVESYDVKFAFWIAAGLVFLGFLVSLRLVYGEAGAQPVEEDGSISDLLKQPSWFLFLTVAFIAGVAFTANNTYFFPYMSELGADSSVMGVALTVGTIAEIPVLFMANRFIARFNAFGTLILSLAITGLRLVLFGLVGSTALVLVIQLFNGLAFPLLMVAAVSYADQIAPAGLRATGQGLLNAVLLGFGAAVGGFVCGILLVMVGGQGLFLVIGFSVLIALGLVVFLRGRLRYRAA